MPKSTLQCSQTCGEPLPTYTSTGDPPTLADSFGLVFCGVTAPFLWDLVCTRFVYALQDWSLFLQVLWKSYNQVLVAFKVSFPGDSQSLCWILSLGSLMGGSEPPHQWENLFGIIFLQFVGHPLRKYRI